MLILAFDTTASGFSIALLDDEKILAEKKFTESGKQSEMLIPEIENLLKENGTNYSNLGLIAATNGPGSFTGVRIGLTAARALKLACKIPLVLVNSCEASAYKFRQKSGKIFAALDAKMDEFFYAEFTAKNGKLTQISETKLLTKEEMESQKPKGDFTLCDAGDIEAKNVGLLALEKFRNNKTSENLDPLYLRLPRITERKK